MIVALRELLSRNLEIIFKWLEMDVFDGRYIDSRKNSQFEVVNLAAHISVDDSWICWCLMILLKMMRIARGFGVSGVMIVVFENIFRKFFGGSEITAKSQD